MKTCFYVLLLSLVCGCQTNPETYVPYLDGYWEIDRVELYDGQIKQFNVNKTVDFITVTDSLTGIRKKLNPNFNGTYTTSNNYESFKVLLENDSLHLIYSTPFATWKESVLFADESKLRVINQNKDVFLYRKYIPLNLE